MCIFVYLCIFARYTKSLGFDALELWGGELRADAAAASGGGVGEVGSGLGNIAVVWFDFGVVGDLAQTNQTLANIAVGKGSTHLFAPLLSLTYDATSIPMGVCFLSAFFVLVSDIGNGYWYG